MRKLFTLIVSLVFVLALSTAGIAGSGAGWGTGGESGANADANGVIYAESYSDSYAGVGDGVMVTQDQFVGVASWNDVNSEAGTFSIDSPRNPQDDLSSVYGQASQNTGLGLYEQDSNFEASAEFWAEGEQSSFAEYSASDEGLTFTGARGSADVIGGGFATGDNYYVDRPGENGYGSCNLGAVGSFATAEAHPDPSTTVRVSGSITTGSYVEADFGDRGGWAFDQGTASYDNSNTANCDQSMAGYGVTHGSSEVYETNDGVRAESYHESYSTTGGMNNAETATHVGAGNGDYQYSDGNSSPQ